MLLKFVKYVNVNLGAWLLGAILIDLLPYIMGHFLLGVH